MTVLAKKNINRFLLFFLFFGFLAFYSALNEYTNRLLSNQPADFLKNLVWPAIRWTLWALFTPVVFYLAKRYPVLSKKWYQYIFCRWFRYFVSYLVQTGYPVRLISLLSQSRIRNHKINPYKYYGSFILKLCNQLRTK